MDSGGGLVDSHPGDDLEARLLLLIDVQHWDDFTQQVGHFLGGALVLLFSPPESVVDVVGDFGEAAQRGDIRVLFELLLETNGWNVQRSLELAEGSVTDSGCKTDSTRMNRGDSYMNEAKAVVVQEVLEGLGQSFVWTADQQAAFIVWRSVTTAATQRF